MIQPKSGESIAMRVRGEHKRKEVFWISNKEKAKKGGFGK